MLNWSIAVTGVLLWIAAFGTYIWHERLVELWARIRNPKDAA